MEETKEGGTCENCGMEYSYINFRNPNRRCLHCGLVGFGSRLTPGAADDAKKMLVKQVEAWLTDYEMPMSAYNLISALVSLGYLSSHLTPHAVDGVEAVAKLSERKTVHEWLNDAGIPADEFGKPICLLRRLRIAIDRLP